MTLGNTYPINQKEGADAGVRWYQAAVAAAPANAAAHTNLGLALKDKGQVDEAIACHRQAIALDPKYATAHYNLGVALKDKGQGDEAIACYRQAIALDPKLAQAHTNLGNALKDKGQIDEAIACYRKAIALDPKYAEAHTNLGIALYDKEKLDEAIAYYHKAIALDPKYANAHNGLGLALLRKGQVDEAIACYHQAIELDPKLATAHYNLGMALYSKGQLDEAIACYQKAVALDPKLANAHGVLGQALLGKGRYAEARDATARSLELLPDKHPLRAFASQQLQTCERFVKLDARLPRLLRGEDKPASAGECLGAVILCRHKRLHAAAARFSADAFAADPKLADNLQTGHRYVAAGSAALAAAGQGEDAGKLDDQERARLRQQALDWLHADLALWGKQLEGGKAAEHTAVQKQMRHWQQDPDLAGLRDATALAKLSAEEQKAFTQLWADVAALLKKADTPMQKEDKR
jgi:tetratricopeptide (TPR) repeat protein